jgi:hypothetical protein
MTIRTRLLLTGACLLAGACSGERARPGPLEPGQRADLAVRITSPANGESVLGDHPLQVRVEASDLDAEGLTAVGLVVRQSTATLDSQVVSFEPRADSAHVFEFMVPNTLPTNTQLDLRGLAFGTGEATRGSELKSVVVIQCTPQIPVCQ